MELKINKDIVIMNRIDYDYEKRVFYNELKCKDDYIAELKEKLNKALDYLDDRKEEFDNASEESREAICSWTYELLLNGLYKIIRGKE